VQTRFCIMATGCLSAARIPDFPGVRDFEGETYHTGAWPHEGVDFTGKRVGVIGTGSSGIQSTPIIAEQASHLTVFQRTANFTLPAGNRPLSPEEVRKSKETLLADREHARQTPGGLICFEYNEALAEEMTPEAREKELSDRWTQGGFAFLGSYGDIMATPEANDIAADFARAQMRAVIKIPPSSTSSCRMTTRSASNASASTRITSKPSTCPMWTSSMCGQRPSSAFPDRESSAAAGNTRSTPSSSPPASTP
jgi:cyclohexanone monooxygenase